MPALQPGQPAPEFSAETADGRTISLADFRGRQSVVLYFYPRDYTSICTQQACAFRDSYEDFVAAGAAVIGVSCDSLDRHRKFAEAKRLPFVLLSDADGQLRKKFGVADILGLIPRRVTFVIGPDGIVRHVFSAMFTADRHVHEALQTVRQLAAQSTTGSKQ